MHTVYIRRQFNDHQIAKTYIQPLDGIHWGRISGGVHNIAPQYFIYAYALCTGITGEISHSCRHGPPPHRIKIIIIKKDNHVEIYDKLLKIAGARPTIFRAKPYNSKSDIDAIYNALIFGGAHSAIENKAHKKLGDIIIIKPKMIKRLTKTGSDRTIRIRAKKVASGVYSKMKEKSDFEKISYGHWLVYKKIN